MFRRSTPIKLDKERNLRYDMLAKANIQQALGKPVNKVLEDISNIGEYELLVILTCGLTHEDKQLDLEKVSNILYESDTTDEEIVVKLYEALAESNGKGEEFRSAMSEKQQSEAEKNQ